MRVVNSMEENFISWMDYSKSELEAVKELIKDRNTICVEYYKANLALSDKKKWLLDPKNKSVELLDPANLKIMGITKEQAMENNNLFKRAILPEETRVVKKLANYFAFFNNKIFQDIMRQNDKTCKRWIQEMGKFTTEQIQLITENHLVWAELISHLADYNKKLASEIPKHPHEKV